MKYQHVLSEVFLKPWAILPEKFAVISEIVKSRASGETLTEKEISDRLQAAAIAAGPRGGQQSFGSVAVLPIYGVITRRAGMMSQISGGTSIEGLTSRFRAALADPSVKAIVFDVDSPGGSVEGVPELADEIYGARKQKKITAVANPMAASAAYWLASAAADFACAPSGSVGSIGVFTEHEDLSKMYEKNGVSISLISAGKYKTEGNQYEPLSPEARADLQSKVDAFYGMFVKAVARGRGAAQADVRDGFGQGRMVLAADALKEGMIDRVATLEQVLQKLGVSPGGQGVASAALRADQGDGDDDMCMCACQACRADNCQGCTNAECADPNCEHEPRAEAKAPAAPLADIERRRHELDLI